MGGRRVFKLGTRGSPLAMWQARRVRDLLSKARPAAGIEIVTIQTSGDKILDKPLVQIGGKGIFTKEIEDALLDGAIDFAVHSFKDLPTKQPGGLAIAAVPERENPFDALVSRGGGSLAELPENPVVATGSHRRRSQVLAARPGATVVDIRGNVNTRLKKFDESDWHALVMARAALERMGWLDRISGTLDPKEMLPAPAQGALAIETRVDDGETIRLLEAVHNADVAASVRAERAFLAALEGGCQVPIAAHAVRGDGILILDGLVASLDGKTIVRGRREQPLEENPEALGRGLAEEVLDRGGREIVEELIRREEAHQAERAKEKPGG